MKESKEKKDPNVPNPAMKYDFICMCKSKPSESEKLLHYMTGIFTLTA